MNLNLKSDELAEAFVSRLNEIDVPQDSHSSKCIEWMASGTHVLYMARSADSVPTVGALPHSHTTRELFTNYGRFQ